MSDLPSPLTSPPATAFIFATVQPVMVCSTGVDSNWLASERCTVTVTSVPDDANVATSARPSPSKSPVAVGVEPLV